MGSGGEGPALTWGGGGAVGPETHQVDAVKRAPCTAAAADTDVEPDWRASRDTQAHPTSIGSAMSYILMRNLIARGGQKLA